ncbi:MAG: hypothetical protein PWQ57_1736 [Desulfovibrionales bacterium]|nr:hypothetical protein [Desulfovibrionales bacterium]
MRSEATAVSRHHAPRPSPAGVSKYAELIRAYTGLQLTPEEAEVEAADFLALCHTIMHAELKTSPKNPEKLGAGEAVR